MMYIIDDRCYSPMHGLIQMLLIAMEELIHWYEPSIDLVYVALWTLYRELSSIELGETESWPEHELSDKALIIISADNIDFLHSFSRVYCGEKKKSFHGTTIQAVQSIPSLKSLNVTQITGQKRPKLSPYPSPNKSFNSPVSKVTRRARSFQMV